jgi:hypothetical protein
MKKLLTFAAVASLSCLTNSLRAQRQERDFPTPTGNASQVYFELFGPSIIYSITYDGRLANREDGIGFRLGIGGASVEGSGFLTVPFQMNYLVGYHGNYMEFGLGATYASNIDLFETEKPQTNYTYGTFTIGYRKQPVGKMGFTFRACFSPIFSFANGGSFVPFAGVSWGFRF